MLCLYSLPWRRLRAVAAAAEHVRSKKTPVKVSFGGGFFLGARQSSVLRVDYDCGSLPALSFRAHKYKVAAVPTGLTLRA